MSELREEVEENNRLQAKLWVDTWFTTQGKEEKCVHCEDNIEWWPIGKPNPICFGCYVVQRLSAAKEKATTLN